MSTEETTLKTRISLLHDTEENWNNMTDFTPYDGEVIVYDKSDLVSAGIKVGDGSTNLRELPFLVKSHTLKSDPKNTISKDKLHNISVWPARIKIVDSVRSEDRDWANWGSSNVSMSDTEPCITCYYENIGGVYDIVIEGVGLGCIYTPQDATSLFSFRGYTGPTSITGLELLNTSYTTDMSNMFDGCSSLTTLDLSTWDTSNVTNMTNMFNGCSSLESLGVSTWNTSKVISTVCMFEGCSSLKSLDLSTWNTSNVAVMFGMFNNCTSLKRLDLSSFNTYNVIDDTNLLIFESDKPLRLEELTLGAAFNSTSINLPTPDPKYIPGATGNWKNAHTFEVYDTEVALLEAHNKAKICTTYVPQRRIECNIKRVTSTPAAQA